MSTQLSTARAHFDREGYVIIRAVLDPLLVEEARRDIAWLLERNPHLRPERLTHELVTHDPFWVRLVSDPRLLDIAEQFVGPNVALFASHYLAKPPHDGLAVLWHQDGSYWPLEPMEVVTIFLALDDCTPDNGCMRVIPRTQSMTLGAVRKRDDVANVLQSGMDESRIDEGAAVDLVLAAGDISIHHPNIVHGSAPNTSAHWRRSLNIRYIPTTTRITRDPPWPHALLLRGQAVPGVNIYQPWPRYVEGEHMPFRGCEAWA
jgi:ectoine hydroxylase-related dioxygenase (phytanoyl-CoA dioxygenase family)